MKKIISISLLLVFLLAGCAGQSNNKQDGTEELLSRRGFPDFERPEGRPNISGIVKNIIGNEITILKIERPEINEREDGDESKQRPSTSGFSGGMHGMGGGMGRTGSSNDSERIEMLKRMSAGEEKIIVPVGIKMLKKENEKMVEAILADITSDKMLMIWTDQSITDRNIANFVIIN